MRQSRRRMQNSGPVAVDGNGVHPRDWAWLVAIRLSCQWQEGEATGIVSSCLSAAMAS
jgi:hypothetical protein